MSESEPEKLPMLSPVVEDRLRMCFSDTAHRFSQLISDREFARRILQHQVMQDATVDLETGALFRFIHLLADGVTILKQSRRGAKQKGLAPLHK